jgi:hypothetical protein
VTVASSAGWCVALFRTFTVSGAAAPGVLGVWAMLAAQKEEASSAEIAAKERSFVDGRDIKVGGAIVRSSCSTPRNLDAKE